MERAQSRVEAAEAALEKLQGDMQALVIVSPKSGVLTTELKKGARLQEGAVVGTVKGTPVFTADFKIKDASRWSPDDEVELVAKDGGAKHTCRVIAAEDGLVSAECGEGLVEGAVLVLPETP